MRTMNKMPVIQRAKQFTPFSALKGLTQALKKVEYEHEAIEKGNLLEETVEHISLVLASLNKNDYVNVKYHDGGHIKEVSGKCALDIVEQKIVVGNQNLNLLDICDIIIVDKVKGEDKNGL